MARLRFFANIIDPEECRVPVGRPDFKSGRGCQQSLVGSTPILFRQTRFACFGGIAHARHREDHNERAQGPRHRRGSSYSPAGQRVALAPSRSPRQYEGR
jgi:hypothetical protein